MDSVLDEKLEKLNLSNLDIAKPTPCNKYIYINPDYLYWILPFQFNNVIRNDNFLEDNQTIFINSSMSVMTLNLTHLKSSHTVPLLNKNIYGQWDDVGEECIYIPKDLDITKEIYYSQYAPFIINDEDKDVSYNIQPSDKPIIQCIFKNFNDWWDNVIQIDVSKTLPDVIEYPVTYFDNTTSYYKKDVSRKLKAEILADNKVLSFIRDGLCSTFMDIEYKKIRKVEDIISTDNTLDEFKALVDKYKIVPALHLQVANWLVTMKNLNKPGESILNIANNLFSQNDVNLGIINTILFTKSLGR